MVTAEAPAGRAKRAEVGAGALPEVPLVLADDPEAVEEADACRVVRGAGMFGQGERLAEETLGTVPAAGQPLAFGSRS
jgi:hypothetical protein